MADGQKTEKATPKKRRDERKKGNIFFSNDAVSVVVLLVSFLVLRLSANWIAAQIYEFLRYCMDLIAQPSMDVPAEGSGLFIHLLGTFVKAAVPLLSLIHISEPFFSDKAAGFRGVPEAEAEPDQPSAGSETAVFPAQCCGGAERTAEDCSSSDTDFPVYHQRAGPVYQISLHRSFGGLCPSV